MDNLRQWGVALLGYLDERPYVFPTYGCESADQKPDLDDPTAWYNVPRPISGFRRSRTKRSSPGPAKGTPKTTAASAAPLCPCDRGGGGRNETHSPKEYYSSYTMNSWIDNAANGKPFSKRLRHTQIRTPARFVVFSETGNGFASGVNLGTLDEKACRHGRNWRWESGSINLCFADGHVENVQADKLGCGLKGLKETDNYGGIQWNPNNPDLDGPNPAD